jgi:hypothetical protein
VVLAVGLALELDAGGLVGFLQAAVVALLAEADSR